MFLRYKNRRKDGKDHRYWSIVENRRTADGRVVQRQVLYLGEINDSQRGAWCRTIQVVDPTGNAPTQVALFPDDRTPPVLECDTVQIRLSGLSLHRPRQWGACWLACERWSLLRLDDFWRPRLPPSRKGTRWLNVLKTLVCYRLIDPGSEWRLHRHWFDHSAMGDLLGEDFRIAHSHTLYRCLDQLLVHKPALFSSLRERWQSLFGIRFEVLLYDLTSTYFECDPPAYLCRLSRLLPASHPQASPSGTGTRPDPPRRLGEIRRPAHDRCPCANHRWANLDPEPLYRARAGSATPAATITPTTS